MSMAHPLRNAWLNSSTDLLPCRNHGRIIFELSHVHFMAPALKSTGDLSPPGAKRRWATRPVRSVRSRGCHTKWREALPVSCRHALVLDAELVQIGPTLAPERLVGHIRAPETASASAASANTVDRTVRSIGIASAKRLGNFVHPAMGTLPALRCVDHPSSVDCMSLDLSSSLPRLDPPSH